MRPENLEKADSRPGDWIGDTESRIRCLSLHAGYRCRHRGECCRADWQIDVDTTLVHILETHRVKPQVTTLTAFSRASDGAITLSRTDEGWCGFRHDFRCSLQRAGGESLLPNACRHFPRIFLRDGRGWSLTLSHFCPTAAAMLLEETAAPVAIVEAGPPLALEDPREGLDARDELPPLLRPGLLMDLESYAAWEEAAVRRFAEAADPLEALDTICAATERTRAWNPSGRPLLDHVHTAFTAESRGRSHARLSRGFRIVSSLTGSHPLLAVAPDFERQWQTIWASHREWLRLPLGRYLAAATFANWIAYRGQGLRTIVEWLRACYDVLRLQLVREFAAPAATDPRERLVSALRMSDYVVVHTVDSLAFGRAAAVFEQQPLR